MNLEKSPLQRQLTAWLLRRTASTGVRRVVSLAAAIASETGNVRTENQDRAAIVRGTDSEGKDFAVVAVADGIGGMQDGGICAAITLGAFFSEIQNLALQRESRSTDWLLPAVLVANETVHRHYAGNGGATLVALLLRPGHPVTWLSVGDSRVYCSAGKLLTQLSIDDTIAGQLGKNSEAAFEQSKLLQFIGMGSDLEPHIEPLAPGPVDGVLLTTDGVHFLASSPGWMGQIVGNAADPGVCVKRLVDLAKWCGGPDNATVAMIDLSNDIEPEARADYPCLEVWDAFGELQILISLPALGVRPSDRNTSSTGAHFKPTNAPPVTVQESSRTPEANNASEVAVKAGRGKSTRKTKAGGSKRAKGARPSSDTAEPQLLMDFPTKVGQ